MKKLVITLLSIFVLTTSAFAVDGQISSQYTHYRADYQTFDTQFNVGQAFFKDILRPYVQVQWVNASVQGIINDSQLTYTGGVEVRLIPDQLKLDGGVGYYQPIGKSVIQHNEFFYVKATYAFDTSKK
jgi:hypothetical protein